MVSHSKATRSVVGDLILDVVAEFISPPKKVYTFNSIGDYSISTSVKCADSATKWNLESHKKRAPLGNHV